jgi:hypothetical protein
MGISLAIVLIAVGVGIFRADKSIANSDYLYSNVTELFFREFPLMDVFMLDGLYALRVWAVAWLLDAPSFGCRRFPVSCSSVLHS